MPSSIQAKRKQASEEASESSKRPKYDEKGNENSDDDEAAFFEETTNSLLREDTSTVELNGGTYTFHMQLLDFLGGAGIREVSVKIYFTADGKEDAATKSTEEPKTDDDEIGYLTGFLLPRPVTEGGPSFYEMADSVSDELAELTSMFCNRQGHLTRVDVGLKGKGVQEGGFFQIYSLEIKGPGHAGKCDLGLHAVHSTLEFLKDEWNIAVMVPLLLGVQIQRWPEFHNRLKIDLDALEHSKEQTEGLHMANLKIKRHFARMGFIQLGRNSEQHQAWYLTRPSYLGKNKSVREAKARWKTKKDVEDLDVFVPPDAHVPEGVDQELNQVISSDPVDLSLVRTLVQTKKASIHASRAIFLAAADNDVKLLALLVDELNGQVNEADENSNTPLHVAAMMISNDAIQFLLKHGAKGDATNDKGHTPLQTAKESIEALKDEPNPDETQSGGASGQDWAECLKLLEG